jgi:proteic killer suppression protein
MMRIRYSDAKLERLEADPGYDAGFGRSVVRGFRKVIAWIREAVDERDLYALKSLHYEKLQGSRRHQRSLRLNSQFRLIVEVEQTAGGRGLVIVAIEDYH